MSKQKWVKKVKKNLRKINAYIEVLNEEGELDEDDLKNLYDQLEAILYELKEKNMDVEF